MNMPNYLLSLTSARGGIGDGGPDIVRLHVLSTSHVQKKAD